MIQWPWPRWRGKVKLGVDFTISDDHCTNLSLFFTIAKNEPKIGYDFGSLVEVLDVVLDLMKMKRDSGTSMQKMRVVKKVKSIFLRNLNRSILGIYAGIVLCVNSKGEKSYDRMNLWVWMCVILQISVRNIEILLVCLTLN